MSLFRPNKIYIRNWATVKEAEVLFPQSGLVFLTGRNMSSDAKFESIGSGKTALGEALARATLGVPGRYSRFNGYSRHGAGDTLVQVDATLGSKPFKILNGYKCAETGKSGESIIYEVDGARVQRNTAQDTREELRQLLRIDEEVSQWTVFIDGSKLDFAGLGERDAVGLVSKILQMPNWDDYYARSKAVRDDFKLEVEKCTAVIDNIAAQILSTEQQITSLNTRIDKAWVDHGVMAQEIEVRRQSLQERITTLEEQLAGMEAKSTELSKQLKRLEETEAQENAAHEKLVLESKSALVKAEKDHRDIHGQRMKLQGQMEPKQAELIRLQNPKAKVCPSCRRPLDAQVDRGHIEAEIARVTTEINDLDEQLCQLGERLDTLEDIRDEKEKALTETQAQQKLWLANSQHKQISQEWSTVLGSRGPIQSQLKTATRELGELRLDTSEIEAMEARLLGLKEQIASLRAQTDEKLLAADENKTLLSGAEYWTQAFHQSGIPNLVLTETIGGLNETSRRVSHSLTGGLLEVSYSTTKQVATGSKPKLTISVKNKHGVSDARGSSKGETGLINLIAAETFAQLGQVSARVGWRWYDEVTSGQDSQVRHSIFSYLKDMSQQLGLLIFVVDHSPEAINYADYTLVAVKENGETRYIWN